MLETPVVTVSTYLQTAVIRLNVPRSEIQKVMGPAIGELMSTLAVQGIAAAGPIFSHHFRMDPEVFDFEIGVAVATAVTPSGRVEGSHLPAIKVARTVYCGPHEGLGKAWGQFGTWIKEQGLKTQDNLWEFYVADPESSLNPDEARTELNRPLA
jgi:effector-binding domain-containing protein